MNSFMFNTAEVNAQDVNNYSVSREGIGRAAEIPDLIAGLYHFVYQSIIPTLDTDRRKAAAFLCLPLNAKHLIIGIKACIASMPARCSARPGAPRNPRQ
jgi:hypothetical protein